MYDILITFDCGMKRIKTVDTQPVDSIQYLIIDTIEKYCKEKEYVVDKSNYLSLVKDISIVRCDDEPIDYTHKPDNNDYSNTTIEVLSSSIYNATRTDKEKTLILVECVVSELSKIELIRNNDELRDRYIW